VASLGIAEVIASPASPWQNPYAERLIGSLRRECLDHMIVVNETHLRRTLAHVTLCSRAIASAHGAAKRRDHHITTPERGRKIDREQCYAIFGEGHRS
jgi:Integrase core domain